MIDIKCNYEYRIQDILYLIPLSIMIWQLVSIFTYSILCKVLVSGWILIIVAQKYTAICPISLKIPDNVLITKKLIGEEHISLADIKDIKNVNWGLRYREIYILRTKKKIYLNVRCYCKLVEGIKYMQDRIGN